jgi:hypothetical protein
LFGPGEGIVDIPPAVCVEHEVNIRADGFAEDADKFHVLLEAIGAGTGSVTHKPFLIAEAFGFQGGGAFADFGGFEGVTQAASIDFDIRARGSAQETVDGGFEIAAAQIPKGVVDRGDGHEEKTVSGVPVGAVHLVPEGFAGEGVFAEEEGADLVVDDKGGFAIDRAVETVESGIGADAEIDRVDGDGSVDGGFVGVGGLTVLVVDVERIHLRLGVDSGVGVAVALD